jgi:hypothetical protein
VARARRCGGSRPEGSRFGLNPTRSSEVPPGDGYTVARPGRLAQLGEHQLDKLGVTGSSPVPPITEAPASPGVFVREHLCGCPGW